LSLRNSDYDDWAGSLMDAGLIPPSDPTDWDMDLAAHAALLVEP
jgi:hypothetical protein